MNNEGVESEGQEFVEEIELDQEVPDKPLSSSDDIELDIRESIEELVEKGTKDSSKTKELKPSTAPGAQVQNTETEKKGFEPAKAEAKTDNIPPPATWKVESKEWFNRQPLEVKKELARRTTEMERGYYNALESVKEKVNEYADIDEAIKPYERAWASQGVSRAQGIRNLATAQAYLDRDVIGGIEFIAKSYGTSLEEILASKNNGKAPAASVHNSDIQELKTEIQRLNNELSQVKGAGETSSKQKVLEEMFLARDEMDASGRYLRPELHEEDFVKKLGPIVAVLAKQNPGESPRLLVSKAYTAMTGKNPQPVASRALPQNTQHKEQARRAALSVRGSVAASKPLSKQASKDETVEDTIREVMKDLGAL